MVDHADIEALHAADGGRGVAIKPLRDPQAVRRLPSPLHDRVDDRLRALAPRAEGEDRHLLATDAGVSRLAAGARRQSGRSGGPSR